MKPVTLLLALAAMLFAQSDSISASASRSVFVQPDTVEATIAVTTPVTTTQQQASDALQSAGLPGRLVSARSEQASTQLNGDGASFTYTFVHSAAATDLRDVTRKLDALRTASSSAISWVTYDVSLSASQTLSDEQFQRALPQLIADAKKKGEALASAGGLRLGAVQTVSDLNVASAAPILRYGSGASLQLTFSVLVRFGVE
jgi:uncharacterized protein YggE